MRWLRHLAPIAVPVMAAQLLVEGPRWHLLPAYGLAGLLFLVWLPRSVKPASGPAGRRWTRRLAMGLGVGLGSSGWRSPPRCR